MTNIQLANHRREVRAAAIQRRLEHRRQRANTGHHRIFSTFLWMVLLVLLLGLVMAYFQSKDSVVASRSAQTFTSVPVSATVAGEIEQVLVQPGDEVQKGDLLVRLRNMELRIAHDKNIADLLAAQSKIVTLRDRQDQFQKAVVIASEKLKLDLEIVQAELGSVATAATEAKALWERMKPFRNTGAFSRVELETAESNWNALEAQAKALKNRLHQSELSQQAADSKLLIRGELVDVELLSLETDLKNAESDYERATKFVELSQQQIQQLDIVASRNGRIESVSCWPGQFVKIADRVVSMKR